MEPHKDSKKGSIFIAPFYSCRLLLIFLFTSSNVQLILLSLNLHNTINESRISSLFKILLIFFFGKFKLMNFKKTRYWEVIFIFYCVPHLATFIFLSSELALKLVSKVRIRTHDFLTTFKKLKNYSDSRYNVVDNYY